MRRWVGLALAALVAFSLPALAGAQEPARGEESVRAVPLPLRKVVLFKNGMGYFEHLGEVRGAQVVEIVLPSSQLNDVLKSLTVIDLGRGRIAGVTYDSAAPLARRLAELPIDLRSVRGLVDFLNAIRGTEVEIRAPGGTIAGRLMGAELRARTHNQTTTQVVEVSVFTPGGEIRIVDLESAGGLRVTQESLAGDITRYLGLLGSAHERDLRRLRIQTVGRGRRQLYVSYTSEVPIWKTTYRIVLDEGQAPLLQGWAVVDNTTPLDWLDVELSLVAGAPVSFIYNLSQPIYARRPVVPLPEGVLVSPQTHEATLEEQEGAVPARPQAADEARKREASRLAAAPTPAPGLGTFGRIGEMIRQQPVQAAQAQALGEQFEYRIRQPVTIRRNQSALLPILHTEVKGEKVSVFNDSRGDLRARLGFWLENSTELTLDAGSFTVIDSSAFAGEGLTQTINPGERRLLSYALDLGLEVATNRGTERVRVERVEIHRGVLRFHRRVVEKKTYTVRNNDAKPRTVILEHPVRAGWELTDTAEPVESSANFHRFRVEVKPKQTVEFAVREENPQQTTYALTNITPEQITLWVRQRAIDREIEKALQRIVAKKNEINELNQQIQALEREQNEIFRDQERVRNNLARLGRTPEEANLRLRYIRQLEQQENRLGALRAERARLEDARAAAQKQLDEMLQSLAFDRKLS